MSALADQRCFHHASREAVVRCPECRRFFCRECVIEHRGRMVCSECIEKETGPEGERARFGAAMWFGAARRRTAARVGDFL